MQAFEPLQYLQLAQRLVAEADNPAAIRSAISRAYYAAFLATSAAMGIRYTSNHEGFWKCVGETQKILENYGNALRRKRNSADYDPNRDISAEDGRYCVNHAEQIFKLLDQSTLPPTPPPPTTPPAVRPGSPTRFQELMTQRPMPGPPQR